MIKLDFKVPFSAFQSTMFVNCFTSVYLYLNGMGSKEGGTFCSQWETGSCNGCGNCSTKPHALQESYFFLFDTICGHSALRCRFDGSLSPIGQQICEEDIYDDCAEDNVDFLFGFAGFSYHKAEAPEAFRKEITASLQQNRPVFAKLRGNAVPFAVIIGLDNDCILCPDFKCAQVVPDPAVTFAGIDFLYIIDGLIPPKYTLIDGLKRIEQVMDEALSEDRWGEYKKKIGTYGPDSLGEDKPEGRKARMKRLAETMWHTFNSHNFAELFRFCLPDRNSLHLYDPINDVSKLTNPKFAETLRTIGQCYGYTHDLAWSIIGLEECIDWNDWKSHYYGDMLELVIRQLKENDEKVLNCIRYLMENL